LLRSTRIGEKLRGPLVYYEDGGRKLLRNTSLHLADTKILAPEQPDVRNWCYIRDEMEEETPVDQGKDGALVQNGLKYVIP
jgi:hypothetical protein